MSELTNKQLAERIHQANMFKKNGVDIRYPADQKNEEKQGKKKDDKTIKSN